MYNSALAANTVLGRLQEHMVELMVVLTVEHMVVLMVEHMVVI